MARYAKVYDDIYPNGWRDKPDMSTPINAAALNNITDTIKNIETYLSENKGGDGTGGGSDDAADIYYDASRSTYEGNDCLNVEILNKEDVSVQEVLDALRNFIQTAIGSDRSSNTQYGKPYHNKGSLFFYDGYLFQSLIEGSFYPEKDEYGDYKDCYKYLVLGNLLDYLNDNFITPEKLGYTVYNLDDYQDSYLPTELVEKMSDINYVNNNIIECKYSKRSYYNDGYEYYTAKFIIPSSGKENSNFPAYGTNFWEELEEPDWGAADYSFHHSYQKGDVCCLSTSTNTKFYKSLKDNNLGVSGDMWDQTDIPFLDKFIQALKDLDFKSNTDNTGEHIPIDQIISADMFLNYYIKQARGELHTIPWNSEKAYSQNDCVWYNGGYYMSMVSENINNLPPNKNETNDYWSYMFEDTRRFNHKISVTAFSSKIVLIDGSQIIIPYFDGNLSEEELEALEVEASHRNLTKDDILFDGSVCSKVLQDCTIMDYLRQGDDYSNYFEDYYILDALIAEGSSTNLIPNPELDGSEVDLTALEVDGTKYKITSGGSASIDYGDEEAFNEWSATAKEGEIFVRTDDNEGGGSGGNKEAINIIPAEGADVLRNRSFYKDGVVYLSFTLSTHQTIPQGVWTTIATLEKYAPNDGQVDSTVFVPDNVVEQVRITTDGNIDVYQRLKDINTSSFLLNTSYVV